MKSEKTASKRKVSYLLYYNTEKLLVDKKCFHEHGQN